MGINHITASAIMAGQYSEKYDLDPEIAAMVVKKNRVNGLKNPCITDKTFVSVEDILASEYLSWPIKAAEVGPLVDGAWAVVLVSESKAEQLGISPVWIKGLGWGTDSYYIGDRDLTEFQALGAAAERAYSLAGIGDPLLEIDIAEIHDLTPHHELLAYEALGFCGRGEAAELIRGGVTEADGALPVNLSG